MNSRASLGRAFALSLLPCLFALPHVGCRAQPKAPTALDRLQGTWEGYLAGAESSGKCTITIRGRSLHFHRDAKFWFETTFTLPEGTAPPQLHATIQRSAPPESGIGEVMLVIFQVDDERLILAGEQGSGVEPPEELPADPVPSSAYRYDLRKVRGMTPGD